MVKRIAIIQGHPDSRAERYCHALALTYLQSARASGHEVSIIKVGELEFPMLRTSDEWEKGELPCALGAAQAAIAGAQHLFIIYPLWLGSMPALLKAFFEQCFRPGFAVPRERSGPVWKKPLAGRSARVVVTMGMPALFYRWFYLAHSLRSLERNILRFCGIKPVTATLIGNVASLDERQRQKWLETMRRLGRDGT